MLHMETYNVFQWTLMGYRVALNALHCLAFFHWKIDPISFFGVY